MKCCYIYFHFYLILIHCFALFSPVGDSTTFLLISIMNFGENYTVKSGVLILENWNFIHISGYFLSSFTCSMCPKKFWIPDLGLRFPISFSNWKLKYKDRTIREKQILKSTATDEVTKILKNLLLKTDRCIEELNENIESSIVHF